MSKNPIMESITKFAKKMRAAGIIVSICLIILGIFALTAPAKTSLLIAWLFLAGVTVSGIFEIVKYVKAPAELRQSWSLVSGILSVLIGLVAILYTGMAGKVYILSIAICFQLLMTGIGHITMASNLKKEGATGTGWMTASGVIDIIASIFFITSPFMMTFAYEWVMGIYLVIGGIALLAELLSAPKAK